MSRKHKFYNKEGRYFASFATVYWIDVFAGELYFSIITESSTHCRNKKGLELYCRCIMPSHLYITFAAKENNPSGLLRDFKTYISKKLQKLILENQQEIRKEWMSWIACSSE